jgi:hypothetical protein
MRSDRQALRRDSLHCFWARVLWRACQAEPRCGFASTPGQLPKDVVPSAYRIDLAPDLDQLQFSAWEQIDVDVAKSTDVVTVNAVDLTIKSVTAFCEDTAPAQVTIDAAHESASFHFARGARYQAAKAAENIQEKFAFKNKLLPPLAQWLRVN